MSSYFFFRRASLYSAYKWYIYAPIYVYYICVFSYVRRSHSEKFPECLKRIFSSCLLVHCIFVAWPAKNHQNWKNSFFPHIKKKCNCKSDSFVGSATFRVIRQKHSVEKKTGGKIPTGNSNKNMAIGVFGVLTIFVLSLFWLLNWFRRMKIHRKTVCTRFRFILE